MSWTEPRVSALKTYWLAGFSAAEIAARLGETTRNAVIGKAHRLGIAKAQPRRSGPAPRAVRALARPCGRPINTTPVAPYGRRAVSTLGRSEKPALTDIGRPPVAPAPEARSPAACTLLELDHQRCHWPIGDPRAAGFHFCGAPATAEPYCPAHASRAFRGRA
jgi:GcrA cell cycle regulator